MLIATGLVTHCFQAFSVSELGNTLYLKKNNVLGVNMDISKSYLEFKILFNFFDFFRVAFSLVLKLLVTNICLRFYKIQLHTEK